MKRLNDLIPSTATCQECGEEFDTGDLDCEIAKCDGAEWVVCQCPHCGNNYWCWIKETETTE